MLVATIGAFIYYAAAKPETKETGRLAFFAGLLAFLLQAGPAMIGAGK